MQHAFRTDLTDAERRADRTTIAEMFGETVLFDEHELEQAVPTFHRSVLAPHGVPDSFVELPSVHAIAFGKPCSECWPGGEIA
jgi:hypothetical protein